MLRFVVFIALFAAVVYAGFWLLDRRKGGGGTKPAKPIPRGPVGPDDDEDFLRELARRRRHSKDGQSKNGQPKDAPSNTPPKNAKPKDTPPKRGPRPAQGQQPKDPQANEAQPNPQPTEGKPNDGEA
jgi:hypothetical protein